MHLLYAPCTVYTYLVIHTHVLLHGTYVAKCTYVCSDEKHTKLQKCTMYIIYASNRAIIDGGKISHNEKLRAFTVEGTGGNVHAVRLFPTASCTCPTTGSSCYHILAAKMSIGIEDINSRHKVNLTMLRKNIRSKKDKTSGRKKPQVDDYDITVAPDSIKNTSIGDDDFIVDKVSRYTFIQYVCCMGILCVH